jgi:general secretion pathway protein K
MRRERGVAAVTAILIVAVAASAAAVMLSQQSAMLDQTMMVASRAQAEQYAQAGIDWARGVLADDSRRDREVDSLDEGWARPIAALPVERATVAGLIDDEQGKLNLNNLAPAGKRSDPDILVLRTLLGSLDLSPLLADAVADWVDGDGDLAPGGGGAEDAYYLALPRPYRTPGRAMVQVEELYRVRGFDAAAVAKLKPHVAALPLAGAQRTAINVNTASDVVLAAVLGLSRERAAVLARETRTRPWRTIQPFRERVRKDGVEAIGNILLDVKSGFFSVRVQVAQDEVQLASQALVQRRDDASTAIIWRRPLY